MNLNVKALLAGALTVLVANSASAQVRVDEYVAGPQPYYEPVQVQAQYVTSHGYYDNGAAYVQPDWRARQEWRERREMEWRREQWLRQQKWRWQEEQRREQWIRHEQREQWQRDHWRDEQRWHDGN